MAWNFNTACAAKGFMSMAMKHARDQHMDFDEASYFMHKRVCEFAEILYPDSDAKKYIEVKDISPDLLYFGEELFNYDRTDFAIIMVVVYNEYDSPLCNYTFTGAFPIKKGSE
jgi:hypothetical protein